MVKVSAFGLLSDGRTVMKYTIMNQSGSYIELLDYGATIHSIFVKDRSGHLDNIVISADNVSQLEKGGRFASVIGRCANGIAYGRYRDGEKIIQLETNRGQHFFHGGSGNYAGKLFTGSIMNDENSVVFFLKDIGEGGFDTTVDVKVKYSFDEASALTITYEMTADGTTVLCPTNHAYFNLDGKRNKDIRSHVLQVNSLEIAEKGESGLPEGKVKQVEGTSHDFLIGRCIKEALRQSVLDECYIINKNNKPAAVLISPFSGRKLSLYTDMPGLILFTSPPKVEDPYYRGVCLETQFVPNAVNCQGFDKPLFKSGETFLSQTRYVFESEYRV